MGFHNQNEEHLGPIPSKFQNQKDIESNLTNKAPGNQFIKGQVGASQERDTISVASTDIGSVSGTSRTSRTSSSGSSHIPQQQHAKQQSNSAKTFSQRAIADQQRSINSRSSTSSNHRALAVGSGNIQVPRTSKEYPGRTQAMADSSRGVMPPNS